MTVKAWCIEHDINEKQFYYWQRKVREAACTALSEDPETQPVFAPLISVGNSSPERDCGFKPDLVLRTGDMVIELSNSASPELLAFVWKASGHV